MKNNVFLVSLKKTIRMKNCHCRLFWIKIIVLQPLLIKIFEFFLQSLRILYLYFEDKKVNPLIAPLLIYQRSWFCWILQLCSAYRLGRKKKQYLRFLPFSTPSLKFEYHRILTEDHLLFRISNTPLIYDYFRNFDRFLSVSSWASNTSG